MLEGAIQSWSVKYARKRGFWARKFRAAGRRSAPDYIFAKDGVVFWVEFKASGVAPSDLQLEEHKEMRAHGLTVFVCDSRDTFPEIIARYL